MNDRSAELDSLDWILPTMFDQRSTHEHDWREPIKQAEFAHGVGDVDIGGSGRQLLARTQRDAQPTSRDAAGDSLAAIGVEPHEDCEQRGNEPRNSLLR